MKKIVFTLTVMLALSGLRAQSLITHYALVYSNHEKALVYENNQKHNGHRLYIKSLPSVSENNVPVKIKLKCGNYTLAKSPELVIPSDCRIYVEDTWTEVNYDLESSESYAFMVQNNEQDRFVMHISRTSSSVYASR